MKGKWRQRGSFSNAQRLAGTSVPTAYLSALCVHPDYRRQGLLKTLLTTLFECVAARNVPFVTLVPAEKWLFDAYGKCGFATLFTLLHERFQVDDSAIAQTLEIDSPQAWHYLWQKLQARPFCVNRPPAEWKLFIEELKHCDNACALALSQQGKVVAAAVYNGVLIDEIVAENVQTRTDLLTAICRHYGKISITVRQKGNELDYGMGRIIDAEAILSIFAKHNPHISLQFELIDNEIPQNNGTFSVTNGTCKRISACNAPKMTIAQLATTIFSNCGLQMSLVCE